MFGYFHYQKNEVDFGRFECCKCFKHFLKFLTLLANLTQFILLCILIKLISNDDLEDDINNYGEILGLSIATLIVTCAYILLGGIYLILFMIGLKKKNCLFFFLCSFLFLLWISRYILFVILMHYIESSDIETSYNNNFYKYKNDDINNLKNCFHGFAIVQIIVDAIGQLEYLIPDKDDDND